MIGVFNPPALT